MNREQLHKIRQRADWLRVNKDADDTITGYVLFAAALASAADVPALLDEIDRLNAAMERVRSIGEEAAAASVRRAAAIGAVRQLCRPLAHNDATARKVLATLNVAVARAAWATAKGGTKSSVDVPTEGGAHP